MMELRVGGLGGWQVRSDGKINRGAKENDTELGKLIRNHWRVVKACHHLLNMTCHEDHCQVRDKIAAHSLTLVRELSARVLKAGS